MFHIISLWEIEIKSTTHLLNSRITNSNNTNVGKDTENLDFSYIVGEICTITQLTLDKSLAISRKTNHVLIIQMSNYTPGQLFQGNKDLYSQKNLYMNYLRSFICNKNCKEPKRSYWVNG